MMNKTKGKRLKTYHLELRGTAAVKGSVSVSATDDKDAVKKMRKNLGDVVWEYDGVDEDSVEITNTGVKA